MKENEHPWRLQNVFPYTELYGKTLSCATKWKVVMEEEGEFVEVQ